MDSLLDESAVTTWRLLLVEDELTQLRVLERRLTKAGYEVETAMNGEDALAKLLNGHFHILITDWDMEPMDGATLCRRVRETATLDRYLYIIMLTGHNSVADVVAGFDAGADDYLRKPADEAELLARLKAGRRILELEQTVQRLSLTDPLLGIYNRRYLDLQLLREVERAQRYQRSLSVVIADLDHFKRVNDEHGHQTGDAVLRGFATRARSTLRLSDWMARYGGEEFVLVLPDTDLNGALEAAEKVRAACESAPVLNDGISIRVTASFGVAHLSSAKQAESAEQLLSRADTALYEAKRGGRNCVRASVGPLNDATDRDRGADEPRAA